ncbi:MAG: MATE family efflux transporter [Microbacteriaceae bacterium]
MKQRRQHDREILRLAVPTLAALVAEPLFILLDTALVGHLGPVPLAGLGIASVILQTTIGLLVFLAYATTPAVARKFGAGDVRGAVRAGVDGVWLSLLLGVLLLAAGLGLGSWVVTVFGADSDVAASATEYLMVSVWGLPAMLVVLATTGLLRGLLDTRTPLVIVAIGFSLNAALNVVFIYGCGWGIAGSALGTVVAQWVMAAAFLAIVVRLARTHQALLTPGFSGVFRAARSGGWLLIRTVSLRAAMLATVFTGVTLGVTQLAALNVALAVFSLLAFVLDALAIAGQALVGKGLGASRPEVVREISRRLITFGLIAGLVIGAVLALLSPILGYAFTGDQAIREALVPVIVLMALGMPIAGYVFVLDGVLIGAGDARYLALTGILNLAVYLPVLWLAANSASLLGVWVAFGSGYMLIRALTLSLRVSGERWLRVDNVTPGDVR